MVTDAGSSSPAPPSDGARPGRVKFPATASGGGDNVEVAIARDGEYARVYVANRLVVKVPRRNWRMWLRAADSVEAYLQPPMIMQRDRRGAMWLQMTGLVAPQIISPTLRDRLVELLED